MLFVKLSNLSFHSYHGIHAEERVLGGKYELDIEVGFEEKEMINRLDQSVDYSGMFEIVKKVMDKPTPMLETIVMTIGERIKAKYPLIEQIKVSITKFRPPIEKMEGYSVITWEWRK